MSLKSVARGMSGQSWFAAQNRKATASMIALRSSSGSGRRMAW